VSLGRSHALLTLALLLVPSTGPAADWEPVYQRDGIAVAWRAVASSPIREIRAAGIVDRPAARLLAVLGDVDNYPRFMPPTERTRTLKREGATGWFYVEINPALVSRRDYCVRVTIERLADGTLENRWEQTEELCPPSPKGVIRMRHTEGRWRLTPLDGQRTFADYQAITDPGGALPAWIVNYATSRAMRQMFQALARTAADPRFGRCAPGDFGCGW
jgi:ribosome-associated toxin RatA of RatAB toxin-antitoxin module